ncbi:MAG: hypothetical protein ACUVRS_06255 [Armatimonadota bacterium]
MNTRIPVIILACLVLAALIWRIANPPSPPLPGPLGAIPTWDSSTSLGEMSACAVSPSGRYWAGAWNEKTRSGELRSAVLVIDLEKSRSYQQAMKPGYFVTSVGWEGDSRVWAVVVDSDDPVEATKAGIVWIHRVGDSGLSCDLVSLKQRLIRILDWPVGCEYFLAHQGMSDSRARIGVFTRRGEPVGRYAEVSVPKGSSVGGMGATSRDGRLFVFSIIEDRIGGMVSFYLGDSKTGALRKVFSSQDLPGRVEKLWVSGEGILIVCAERENFHVMKYDLGAGLIAPAGRMKPEYMKAHWPDAPDRMMFSTYNAGYELRLSDGSIRRLYDLTKLGRFSDAWRRQVQDGRLYPRKDGDYTSISLLANEVDIRVIKRSGDRGANILPRH